MILINSDFFDQYLSRHIKYVNTKLVFSGLIRCLKIKSIVVTTRFPRFQVFVLQCFTRGSRIRHFESDVSEVLIPQSKHVRVNEVTYLPTIRIWPKIIRVARVLYGIHVLQFLFLSTHVNWKLQYNTHY